MRSPSRNRVSGSQPCVKGIIPLQLPQNHILTKNMGGGGTSSKFSLSSSPVARTAPSQLTCPASLTLFCSGACALFRLAEDPISFLFNRFPPLLQKHGGWSS